MKWTVEELIEQALIYAIQDREGFYEACHEGDEYGEQAKAMAKAFRRYHAKRFKRKYINDFEQAMAEATTVSLHDLMRQTREAK